MSQQKKVFEKECKYECGRVVVWKGKSGQPNSTGFFEKNTGIEHTYDRCKNIKAGKVQDEPVVPKNQTTLRIQEPTTSNTGQYYPVQKTVEKDNITGVTLNSVYIKAANNGKEIKELKKQIEVLTELVDGVSQQLSLVLKTVGYPKPEPVIPIPDEQLQNPIKNDKDIERFVKEENEAYEKDKEKEVVELKPVSMQEEAEWREAGYHEQQEEEKKETLQPKTTEDGWNIISDPFNCHGCGGFKHNGYSQAGTRICEDCKSDLDGEAKEAIEATNKTEEDSTHMHLRTIGDINNDISDDEIFSD